MYPGDLLGPRMDNGQLEHQVHNRAPLAERSALKANGQKLLSLNVAVDPIVTPGKFLILTISYTLF